MTKNLLLDFWREIRRSANRFISILCIVAIGVALFTGLLSSAPDMEYTIDKYYDEFNIMDIQILSTLGLTQDDIDEIAALDVVEDVQAGYFTDALASIGGREVVFRVHSMPTSHLYDGQPCINEVDLVGKDSRMPQNPNEIVVEDCLNYDYGIKVGDEITFYSGTEEALEDGVLHSTTFTVVGMVKSPYYLTYSKGGSQIEGREIDLFSYVSEEAFAYEDMYIEALVTVKGAKEEVAFDAKYKTLITDAQKALQNLGADRTVIRADEIREAAYEELDKAQKEYDDGLAEFNKKISEAEAELEKAYTDLIKGEEELIKEKEKFELEVEHAREQIADGEEQLADAAQQIEEGEKQLETAKLQYEAAVEQYNATMESAQQYLDTLDSLESMMAEILAMMEQNEANGQDNTFLQSLYDDLEAEYNDLKELNANLDASVESVEQLLADTEKSLAESEAQLAQAKQDYNNGAARLANARYELAVAMEEAEEKFAEAEKEIADGWKEYNDGVKEFEEERAKAQAELDDSEKQLIDAKYQIERIENAVWYSLDRTSTYGFASYKNTADRMAALASVLPFFFILVAVLVCMTTMTRMVSEQRGTIGSYKALGYDNKAIASKYVMYVTTASVIGGLIGSVLGVKLFPWAVYNAWASMYYQPPLEQQLRVGVLIASFVITVVAMALTAYFTCSSELKEQPAMLMRPKAPKVGKKILLERIPFFWKRCSFVWKVTFRNIFRYKKRLFMTLIGIMGCTAMLLSALGMSDSIGVVVDNQYKEIYRYDVNVTIDDKVISPDEIQQIVSGSDVVKDSKWIGSTSVTLVTSTQRQSVSMPVVEDMSNLSDYISLRDRRTGDAIKLDDTGIVLTEQLAELFDVSVGDTINVLDSSNVEKNLPVIGVTEHYLFHFAYMTQAAFENYFHYNIDQDTMLIKLNTSSRAKIDVLLDQLKEIEGVKSVEYFGDSAETFEEQITALNSIVILIVISAALLAFVVLYNLININVSERIREIATIRVLGFKDGETAMYVYRESFTLTVVGAIIGLGLGIGLHRVIMKAIEQSDIMFGYYINPLSFVISFALTCIFTILVMLYMYPKIANIQMVESLKSVE